MNSRTVFAAAFLLLLVLTPSVWARKWSDRSGNSMVAKFVRVHEDKVVFLRAGKVVMVPFGDLVAEDQQFLRDDLEKKGQGHLLPAARPDRFSDEGNGGSGESSGEDDLRLPAVERVWTDVDNRKITAALVRAQGDNVILAMNGSDVTVPLTRLRRLDQNYVRTRMMAERAAQAASSHGASSPFPSGGVPGARGMSGRPPWGPGGSGAGPAMPGPGAMPSYGGPPSGPEMYGSGGGHETYEEEEYTEEYESYEEESAPYDEENGSGGGYEHEPEQYAANMPGSHNPSNAGPYSHEPPASHPSSPSFGPPSSGPPSSGPPTPSAPSMPSMPQYEEVGLCSNCNKEVSDEFGAGDNCPHCGVFFEYEEDEHGNTTEVASGSGGSDFRVTGRSVRGIVKLVIFGFVGVASLIGWACRKMFSE